MEKDELNRLRYPIGKFSPPPSISENDIRNYVSTIENTPGILRKTVTGLDDKQLDTPYRPGGWSIRQVIHHLPDSHMNSYIRFKLALTEDIPTIKTYEEAKWAELDDSVNTPVEVSLTLLEALHKRWAMLLKSLSETEYHKFVNHPEWGKIRLDSMLALYDWHCKHHIAHITEFKKRKKW